jgi:predicted transcriptional regulator
MPILTLIPLETKIATLFLVILPAIAVFLLRLSLHKKLQEINNRISRLLVSGEEEGIQPEIVKRLRTRYQNASQKLEHVNTLALIDSIYKDEQLRFSSFKIQFDRADAITRALPNLLIAFGLIGTFLGITSNLTNISEIVTGFSGKNQDISGLVQKLQSPLKDMGIAFSSSLFGLFFGSILTIANTILNTSIAKNQLIASLEDYLDNIYKPTVEGNTRLDTAIDRMVKQQEEFLTRFRENVGATLETSFGKAANQIAKECSKINQIAENVYTNFSNAAGTISTGASTFEYAAKSLESQTQTFAESLHEFKNGVETFTIAANRLENNTIVQNLDRVLSDLNINQQAFTNSTQILQNSLIGITTTNQTAAQLAQQVYETWQDSTTKIVAAAETIGAGSIIFQKAANSLEGQTESVIQLMPELKNGVETFVSAANKVKTNNIVKHLNTLVENLSITQAEFTNSTQILTSGLGDTIANNQQSTKLATQIYQGLGASTQSMQLGANNLLNAAQIIQDSQLGIELNKASTEFSNSTEIFSQAAKNLQPVTAKLEPAIASIDRAINSLQQVGSEVVSLSKNTAQASESTQTAILGFDRNYRQVLTNTESSIQDLGKINRSNWHSLIDVIEQKLQTDRSQNLQSIEAMKEHFIKMSLPDPESLARLLTILEKLENVLNSNQSNDSLTGNGNRKSGIFGISQRN